MTYMFVFKGNTNLSNYSNLQCYSHYRPSFLQVLYYLHYLRQRYRTATKFGYSLLQPEICVSVAITLLYEFVIFVVLLFRHDPYCITNMCPETIYAVPETLTIFIEVAMLSTTI